MNKEIQAKAEALVSQLTLQEKASLCAGSDFWHTRAIERIGLPAVMVSDGPHGLRKQAAEADHLGLNVSIKAVCFPAASATAASFDPELVEKMGEALGDECQAEDLAVVLGPGSNIKRSPLCGRNFEYFSEDPYLAGKMAAGMIRGIQSKGVGTSMKHFAANSMEYRRMSSDSQVDERTLREIYLAAFETAVREVQPWTLMCSYNRLNGVYASDNEWLLNKVLRQEWGFEGLVMSDWGAMNDRPAGIRAGMDLEMPGGTTHGEKAILKAIEDGTLKEEDLNRSAVRVVAIVLAYTENKVGGQLDFEAGKKVAAQVERESLVLLKNENILPLNKSDRVCFIGEYADKPRYQGGGSSHINTKSTTSALQAAAADPVLAGHVVYEKGFTGSEDKADEALEASAVAAAAKADKVVIFAGLPDSFESEGYDRTHLNMPACQNQLIEKVAAVNPNVVVVLHNGSPVLMPWLDKVKGVIEMYLGGQEAGQAAVDALYGDTNPCGRLPETFPLRLEDTPCFLEYPGNGLTARYTEGVFVGYRWYDSRRMPVLFPFGYGLSYTSFAYSDLKLSASSMKDTDPLTATVTVTNTGKIAGKEVVQLYVRDRSGAVVRPNKELKGFAKVELAPGESKEVSFELNKRSLAYYDVNIQDWRCGTGAYDIVIARNASEEVLTQEIRLTSTTPADPVTGMTTLGDIMRDPARASKIGTLLSGFAAIFGGGQKKEEEKKEQDDSAAMSSEGVSAMLDSMPLRTLRNFGILTDEQLDETIEMLNR